MKKIRILGTISLVIGILGIIYIDNSGFEFLFGILAGIGIGWLLTGKIMIGNKNISIRK